MPTEDIGEDQSPIEIRIFDPAAHDRSAFDCGVSRLNNFILRTAKKQQKGDLVRVYVAVHPGENRVLGYHAINVYSLCADTLGALKPHATPPHNMLPAVYLSMIAIDKRCQGVGLGGILLDHAKQKALKVAEVAGAYAMVLDVINDDGAAEGRVAWYARHGFQSFPGAPLKMFLPIATIRQTYAGLDPAADPA
ncbi:MAG: GNAT family N-acetyltransferase [Rhizomicrobium sp.]